MATVRSVWQLPCTDRYCSDIHSYGTLMCLSGSTDQAVQRIGGRTGYLLHISWLKAAKARLMLERMSLGGSLEILIQVCRMDSGTILACKSCESDRQCNPAAQHIDANLDRPLCPMLMYMMPCRLNNMFHVFAAHLQLFMKANKT